jgi:hypothetical protein
VTGKGFFQVPTLSKARSDISISLLYLAGPMISSLDPLGMETRKKTHENTWNRMESVTTLLVFYKARFCYS